MGGPKQNHVKALAYADAIMRHCKKDGIVKHDVIDTLDGFVVDEERLCACDRSGQHLTGELKVLGDMGLRDFQVRILRHDRRSLGLGSDAQRKCNFPGK